MKKAALVLILSSILALAGCGVWRAIVGGGSEGAVAGVTGSTQGGTPPAGSSVVEGLIYVASYALAREGVGLALRRKKAPDGQP
jgi:hypothetical protein